MDFFFLGLEDSLGSDNKFVKLNRLVDFEKFRKTLKGIYTQDMTRQGRPAFDCIMMFKLLLLGQWYSLSDRELASSLRLRIDFMYFTGFTPTSNLPDYSTINKFRNLLIDKRKYKKLFKELNKQLEALGLSINNAKGAIIDATLVESAGRPDKYMDNDKYGFVQEKLLAYKLIPKIEINNHEYNNCVNILFETVTPASKVDLKVTTDEIDCKNIGAVKKEMKMSYRPKTENVSADDISNSVMKYASTKSIAKNMGPMSYYKSFATRKVKPDKQGFILIDTYLETLESISHNLHRKLNIS